MVAGAGIKQCASRGDAAAATAKMAKRRPSDDCWNWWSINCYCNAHYQKMVSADMKSSCHQWTVPACLPADQDWKLIKVQTKLLLLIFWWRRLQHLWSVMFLMNIAKSKAQTADIIRLQRIELSRFINSREKKCFQPQMLFELPLLSGHLISPIYCCKSGPNRFSMGP